MKKLLLSICLGWSISALAQVDSYSGIGYTPRFVHSSAIMDMLHAYEKNFDSVITPFEEVKIMHGGALNTSFALGKFNMGAAFKLNYASYYGETIDQNNDIGSTKLAIYNLSFLYEFNYLIYNSEEFNLGPGVGFDLGSELIYGDITNNGVYGAFTGGLTNNMSSGFYVYVLLLANFGDYAITLRPSYTYLLNTHPYDDLFVELTNTTDFFTFPGRSTYFGLDLYFNMWR